MDVVGSERMTIDHFGKLFHQEALLIRKIRANISGRRGATGLRRSSVVQSDTRDEETEEAKVQTSLSSASPTEEESFAGRMLCYER